MNFKKMTPTQQEIFLVNKYLEPDDEHFDYLHQQIKKKLEIYGFEKTELFLKRFTSDDVKLVILWFEDYLCNLINIQNIEEKLNDLMQQNKEMHFLDKQNLLYTYIANHVTTFDFNGHLNYSANYQMIEKGRLLFTRFGSPWFIKMDYAIPDEDLEMLLQFHKNPSIPMPRFIQFFDPSFTNFCFNCCESITMETNGKSIRLKDSCKHPQGYPVGTIDVNFPTGCIAINDDLRPWFRKAWEVTKNEDKEYDINHQKGIQNVASVYAQQGCLTGFIGNTSPGVYQDPKNPSRLIIGLPRAIKEDPWETEDNICGFKYIGTINTDLWWYSIADMKYLKDTTPLVRTYSPEQSKMILQPHPTLLKEEKNIIIAQVPPGRYRAYNIYHLLHSHNLHYDFDTSRVFIYIERIDDCSPTSK